MMQQKKSEKILQNQLLIKKNNYGKFKRNLFISN